MHSAVGLPSRSTAASLDGIIVGHRSYCTLCLVSEQLNSTFFSFFKIYLKVSDRGTTDLQSIGSLSLKDHSNQAWAVPKPDARNSTMGGEGRARRLPSAVSQAYEQGSGAAQPGL